MKHLGCYLDNQTQTFAASLEGEDVLLNDLPVNREDPITKCFYAARLRHFKVCAIAGFTCGHWSTKQLADS